MWSGPARPGCTRPLLKAKPKLAFPGKRKRRKPPHIQEKKIIIKLENVTAAACRRSRPITFPRLFCYVARRSGNDNKTKNFYSSPLFGFYACAHFFTRSYTLNIRSCVRDAIMRQTSKGALRAPAVFSCLSFSRSSQGRY